MTASKIEFHESSGNVFADLGLPDAEEMLLKPQIVVELHRMMKQRKLTQTAAARTSTSSCGRRTRRANRAASVY